VSLVFIRSNLLSGTEYIIIIIIIIIIVIIIII